MSSNHERKDAERAVEDATAALQMLGVDQSSEYGVHLTRLVIEELFSRLKAARATSETNGKQT